MLNVTNIFIIWNKILVEYVKIKNILKVCQVYSIRIKIESELNNGRACIRRKFTNIRLLILLCK